MKVKIEANEIGQTAIWLDDKRLECVLGYSISSVPGPGNRFVLHLDIDMTPDLFKVDLKNEIDSHAFCKLV